MLLSPDNRYSMNFGLTAARNIMETWNNLPSDSLNLIRKIPVGIFKYRENRLKWEYKGAREIFIKRRPPLVALHCEIHRETKSSSLFIKVMGVWGGGAHIASYMRGQGCWGSASVMCRGNGSSSTNLHVPNVSPGARAREFLDSLSERALAPLGIV